MPGREDAPHGRAYGSIGSFNGHAPMCLQKPVSSRSRSRPHCGRPQGPRDFNRTLEYIKATDAYIVINKLDWERDLASFLTARPLGLMPLVTSRNLRRFDCGHRQVCSGNSDGHDGTRRQARYGQARSPHLPMMDRYLSMVVAKRNARLCGVRRPPSLHVWCSPRIVGHSFPL